MRIGYIDSNHCRSLEFRNSTQFGSVTDLSVSQANDTDYLKEFDLLLLHRSDIKDYPVFKESLKKINALVIVFSGDIINRSNINDQIGKIPASYFYDNVNNILDLTPKEDPFLMWYHFLYGFYNDISLMFFTKKMNSLVLPNSLYKTWSDPYYFFGIHKDLRKFYSKYKGINFIEPEKEIISEDLSLMINEIDKIFK